MFDDKITILKLIKENKDILFGKFSSTITHEIKTKKWVDIAEKAKAVGIFKKDWKYLRDTTWQNWRKRTIEKRDRRMKTGSGGGKKCIYDDSDKIIFEIIGKDSPTLDGLSIPESSGKDSTTINTIITESGVEDQVPTVNENVCNDSVSSGCSDSGTAKINPFNVINPNVSKKKKMKRTVKLVDDDLWNLKKKKEKRTDFVVPRKKRTSSKIKV